MKSVGFFDWKLNSQQPLSYQIANYGYARYNSPVDIHSAMHLGLVISGERIGRMASGVVHSQPGEFYLTAPWEPHSTVSCADRHKLLLLNIDFESLRKTFFTGSGRLVKLILMPPVERMKYLNGKLQNSDFQQQLEELFFLRDPAEKDLLIWNLVQKIFIFALPPEDLSAESSSHYQRLLPALQGLSGRVLTLEEAARKCNLSSSYFAVIFKKQFGLSFGQYERNFRLNGAAAALRQGAVLKEAAETWGFCDKSHLARLLKKQS